jgi:hypothetical protein
VATPKGLWRNNCPDSIPLVRGRLQGEIDQLFTRVQRELARAIQRGWNPHYPPTCLMPMDRQTVESSQLYTDASVKDETGGDGGARPPFQ